jgi:hypothetical protein
MHFHGTPITPRSKLLELVGRNFCVPFPDPRDVECCHEIGQSVMLDNGAYTFWRNGGGDVDIDAYAGWVSPWLDFHTTWCVIPDRIDGTPDENDELIKLWSEFGFPAAQCAPVWHLHEPLDRLHRLCGGFPRVCLGSSGAFATVGDSRWHERMTTVMNELCGNGPPPVWLHMLRGLQLSGSEYPFASADSSSIAQNHAGNNTRMTPRKSPVVMADELDGRQCAPRWFQTAEQLSLLEAM